MPCPPRLASPAGETDCVQQALAARPVGPRGVRILCLDGGGMRGLALVQMLRELERRTGRRVRDMFDLVAGTSTGGMIAAALIIKGFSLDACDDVYKKLGESGGGDDGTMYVVMLERCKW